MPDAGPMVRPSAADVTWSIIEHAPDLAAALEAEAPAALEWVRTWRSAAPAAATVEPFSSPPAFRPPQHARSYCVQLEGARGPITVSVKGSEVVADDLDRILAMASELRPEPVLFTATESLAAFEHRVPWALAAAEAHADRDAALALQRAHRSRYGDFARAPIPLLVYRWGDSVADRHRDRLRRWLSPFARQVVERICRDGLACYAYLYPGPALRWQDVLPRLQGVSPFAGFERRMEAVARHFDPRAAVEGWLTLFTRMLALGFLPCAIGRIEAGNPVQYQNVMGDGGMVDVDAIQRMDAVRTDREFLETFSMALVELANTLVSLWYGKGRDPGYFGIGIHHSLTLVAVWSEVRQRLKRELAAGSPDPRLTRLVESESPLDDLWKANAALHPALSSGHLGT